MLYIKHAHAAAAAAASNTNASKMQKHWSLQCTSHQQDKTELRWWHHLQSRAESQVFNSLTRPLVGGNNSRWEAQQLKVRPYKKIWIDFFHYHLSFWCWGFSHLGWLKPFKVAPKIPLKKKNLLMLMWWSSHGAASSTYGADGFEVCMTTEK